MKNTRILAFILAVIMVVCALPVASLAVYGGDRAEKLAGFDMIFSNDGSGWTRGEAVTIPEGLGISGTIAHAVAVNNASYSFTDSATYYDDAKTKVKQTVVYENILTPITMIENGVTDPKDADNKVVTIEAQKDVIAKKTTTNYNEDGTVSGTPKTENVKSNSYIDLSLANKYCNYSTGSSVSDNDYTKARILHDIYAGRSFIATVDLMLGEEQLGSGHSTIICIINTWVAGGAANFVEPIKLSNSTGEILYRPNPAVSSYQGTGKFITSEKYTTLTFLYEPSVNSGTLYVDGEAVVTVPLMSAGDLAEILSGEATKSTRNTCTVDVEGLTPEEAAVKQGQSFLPTTFRFLQSTGDVYADNFGVYYFNKDTVKGYDLTVNGGTLGLNYYLDLNDDVLADSTATVDFAIADGKTVSLKVADAEEAAGKGYKFTVPVSSAQMAKKITMTVNGEGTYYVYKNGVASDAYTYSVKEYADAVIASGATSENDKALAAAMLNYGAYAQKYFDYDAQNLPVATPDVSKVTDNDISAVTIAGTAPTGTKAALVLDSDITIVIYDKDGNKIGEKKGINSLQLDTEYTIELTGGTNVKVSVLAIGEKVLESNATSDNYKNLIKALKLFADASKPFAAQ